jgi:membrane protein implicated in regulation of membrane protease activity
MEFLLLWIDDLDDAMGAVRHLAPKILGLLFALALFAATGLALSLAPQATLALAALVLSVSLLETVRRRRLERTSVSNK